MAIAGTLVMTLSLMLSQAIESVTRAFYARGDLELILTSPAVASRLFAVRIVAMAVTTLLMTLTMGAPFINVLAWLGGARWLCTYAVAATLSMVAVAIAIVITGALFRTIGPRRTRFIAQILAAVVGAAFAIGVQFAAILSYGTMAMPRLTMLARFAPDGDSILLWPARAVLGEPAALAALLGIGIVALAAAIAMLRTALRPARAGRRRLVIQREATQPRDSRTSTDRRPRRHCGARSGPCCCAIPG